MYGHPKGGQAVPLGRGTTGPVLVAHQLVPAAEGLLEAAGFGVLTQSDVKETMKELAKVSSPAHDDQAILATGSSPGSRRRRSSLAERRRA